MKNSEARKDGLALPAAECDDAWPMDGGLGQSLFGLSLCAGAGGLDLGLHIAHAGYRTVGYVEREAYAAATLVARMEDTALDCAPIWDDVASFDGRPWRGLVDIVHSGYPCQPFSLVGKKLGDKDPRHLWPHVARIVREVEPRFCFFENVGGHLRLGFEQVHDDLRSMGYRVAAGLFTAEEVGASHRRERLFILAYSESEGTRQPRPHHGDGAETGGDSAMVNANGAGFERRNADQQQQRLGEGPPFPPGQTDEAGWEWFLRKWPDLEPAVCGSADGLACRVDRLRLCGNGVVPLVAAYAFRTLASAAGIEES